VMPTRGASQGSVPLHIDPHLSSPSFSLLWSVCKALQAFDQGQCVATCFRCEAGQTQTQHLFRFSAGDATHKTLWQAECCQTQSDWGV
jgi:hypothetical protein